MIKCPEPDSAVMCGIIDLTRYKGFYGYILQQLSKVHIAGQEARIPTMAVGKKRDEILLRLYINDDWLKTQVFGKASTEDQAWGFLLGALEHETLHIVFDHLHLKFPDKLRGDVAVDWVVNSCIDKDKLLEGALLPDMFGFQPHESASWYYQALQNNLQFQKMCKKRNFGLKGMFSNAVKSHDLWEETTSDSNMKDIVIDILRHARDLCDKKFGNIPAEVISHIAAANIPDLPERVKKRIYRRFLARF